jgi:hypothetical protein
MSQIEEELHVDNAPEVEVKPKKVKVKISSDTERARAAVRAKLAAK